MNTAALANFLRHVVFLLYILKMITGIIMMVRTNYCFYKFSSSELVTWNVNHLRNATDLTMDLVFTMTHGLGFLLFVVGALGFTGAVYLYKFPTINFAVGLTFLFIAPGEFSISLSLSAIAGSLEKIFGGSMMEVFNTSNQVRHEDRYASMYETFQHKMENGWNPKVAGSAQNHNYIDYIQYSLKCCGLSGRLYWDIRIPESCCPSKYPSDDCVLSVAHTKICKEGIDDSCACLATIQTETVVFGFLSIGAGAVALYLARLVARHPDGKYTSESSSESDESVF